MHFNRRKKNIAINEIKWIHPYKREATKFLISQLHALDITKPAEV